MKKKGEFPFIVTVHIQKQLTYNNLLLSTAINYKVLTTRCSKYIWIKQEEVTEKYGRAMAQAVSGRPLTAEGRVRSRLSPCGICGGQSGTGTGFSPEYFSLPPPHQLHSTVLHYTEKRKK